MRYSLKISNGVKKIFILSVFIFLCSCSSSSSEEIRDPAVAGGFYPADKKGLEEKVAQFLGNAKKIDNEENLLAIIVPHAGYEFSGQVAAYAYKQLEGRKVRSAVIISNSHRTYFKGIAIDGSNAWQTPLGTVKVDNALSDKLVKGDEIIQYNSEVHRYDHTIEVQLPFLQIALEGDFKIVPVLFGNTILDSYKKLAQLLAENLREDDIVIVSTDMSHYPAYEDANRIDAQTLEAIKKGSVSELEAHIEKVRAQNILGEDTLCCGIDGVKTILELCNILGRSDIEILKYANSGDVRIGDKSRVVGYASLAIYIPKDLEGKRGMTMKGEYLNTQEKKKLIAIAKSSIIEAVSGKQEPQIEIRDARLKENCGAFVTIKKHGQLRGCIGYIIAVKPLYETVRDVAKSAAINDYRFSPLLEEELDEIEIEISALTPLKRIQGIEEIEVGIHGLYMKRGLNSGLLLPQVAAEYGWDKEAFLEHTCLKAGLPKNAWKDESTEIYIFAADVFGEEDVE